MSGAQLIKRHGDTRKALAADITNLYNTGHMVGDIRRCYLSDNVVESLTGPELVTNGDFSNGTTGWGLGAGWSISGGAAAATSADATGITQARPAGVVNGKTYLVTFDLTQTSGSSALYVLGSALWSGGSQGGSRRFIVTASGANFFNLVANTGVSAFTGSIDNISIKEVVADRSYKASGASITGTLTKSAVATNAQLVAYSGFSAANYLREPYSADLDFGTGEWSASAWLNIPASLPLSSFPVIGSELASLSDASVYAITSGGATTSYASGVMSVLTVSSQPYLPQFAFTQLFGLVPGKSYRFKLKLSGNLNRVYSIVFDSSQVAGSFVATQAEVIAANGVIDVVRFIPTTISSSNARLIINTNGTSTWSDLTITEVSAKEVSTAIIADRAFSSGAKINLAMDAGGRLQATAYDGTTTRTVTTTASYNTATWLKARATYVAGKLAISVNGVEVAATYGAPLLTLNNSNAVLTIGNSYALDAPFPGSIALLKFSATVPTAEQAQWMYQQEMELFRDGAQCCLPDSGAIVDLTYDDVTDKWVAVSATNESSWTGLVRTNVTAVSAGSNIKASAGSGIKLNARSTTNPGVDVTIPAYNLREELFKKAERVAQQNKVVTPFDFSGGFTATTSTTGAAAYTLTSVSGLTYPAGSNIVGAVITGTGIPSGTTIVAISGTTIYIDKAATAAASNVQISFTDFPLPVGYETKAVLSGGSLKQEGSTKDYTKLFDGFKETVRFGTTPAYNAFVQIQAVRSAT